MNLANNLVKYELLIQQCLHSILDISQGLKKTLSGCPGQVAFPFVQVTLPDGFGPRQAVCGLNF